MPTRLLMQTLLGRWNNGIVQIALFSIHFVFCSAHLLTADDVFQNCHVGALEQPFPIGICEYFSGVKRFTAGKPDESWKTILKLCQEKQLELYADESCATKEDIDELSMFCTGINVTSNCKVESSVKRSVYKD